MAQYTDLTASEVRRLCDAYGLTFRTVQTFEGGMANSSFLVDCVEGDHVLTVLDNHSLDSARRLTRLLAYLSGAGIATPVAVVAQNGEAVTMYGETPVIIKRFAAGTCHAVLPIDLVRAAGSALAHLHALPTEGAPELAIHGRRLRVDAPEQWRLFPDRKFATWLESTAQSVSHIPTRRSELAIVHGDLFADNIVAVANGSLVLLDWETASFDDPLIDLGMAVVGLCRDGAHFRPDLAVALMAGYEATSRLPGSSEDLRDASVYAALIIAFHRYLRHHVTHPNPAKQDLFRQIPEFVTQVGEGWPTSRRWPEVPAVGTV